MTFGFTLGLRLRTSYLAKMASAVFMPVTLRHQKGAD